MASIRCRGCGEPVTESPTVCLHCEKWFDHIPRDHRGMGSPFRNLEWYPDDGTMGRPPRPGDSYCSDCDQWVLLVEPHPLGHDFKE